MTAIYSPEKLALESDSSLIGLNEDNSCFTLRRTGRKALRFQGRQLVEAVGAKSERELWHDLNIYKTLDQRIVVQIITRHRSASQQDLYWVESFGDLIEAASWLQTYDVTNYAPIPSGLGSVDTSLPWAVMQAVHLRQMMDRIGIDYRSLLTEVFMALDLTDSVDLSTRATSSNVLV